MARPSLNQSDFTLLYPQHRFPEHETMSSPNQEAGRRPSLESMDSIAKQKEGASSSSPPKDKSSVRSAFDKARSKLSSSGKNKDVLAGSEEEYEKQKQKEIEKQKRKDEYERLGLGDKVKFGQGGMQMGS